MQRFVRGFIVDPKLEEKAHQLADDARETLGKANAALNKVNCTGTTIVLSGIGLIGAGFIAGSLIMVVSDELAHPKKPISNEELRRRAKSALRATLM